MSPRHSIRGFTLIEILIVLAIMGIMSALAFVGFRSMYRSATLRAVTNEVYETLTDARTQTLTSRNDMVYGVHVSTSSITRFEGSSYNALSATNRVYSFEGGVTATGSLITNGTPVVFTRLTGVSTASGTIYIRNETMTATKTVIINTSGLIEYGE